jgi:uncharacterized membrane protein
MWNITYNTPIHPQVVVHRCGSQYITFPFVLPVFCLFIIIIIIIIIIYCTWVVPGGSSPTLVQTKTMKQQ